MRSRNPIHRKVAQIGDMEFYEFGNPDYYFMRLKSKTRFRWHWRGDFKFELFEKEEVNSGRIKDRLWLRSLSK